MFFVVGSYYYITEEYLHCFPLRTEPLVIDGGVGVEADLHGAALAGDGGGQGGAAVLPAVPTRADLHVVVGADTGARLQGEAGEGELDLGAGRHGEVPLLTQRDCDVRHDLHSLF